MCVCVNTKRVTWREEEQEKIKRAIEEKMENNNEARI
jgi:hypothetical protein